MKHLSLAAIGLAIAMSVGAQQTTTDEQQQQPTQPKANTKTEENVQPGQIKEGVQPAERGRTLSKTPTSPQKLAPTPKNEFEAMSAITAPALTNTRMCHTARLCSVTAAKLRNISICIEVSENAPILTSASERTPETGG
jgi:hypothetical protein